MYIDPNKSWLFRQDTAVYPSCLCRTVITEFEGNLCPLLARPPLRDAKHNHGDPEGSHYRAKREYNDAPAMIHPRDVCALQLGRQAVFDAPENIKGF